MNVDTKARKAVRLHLTNVTGSGAVQLLQSLLPALELDPAFAVERIHLPEHGPLSAYRCRSGLAVTEVYRRRLPHALSRIAECTWAAGHFDGESPLMVFGDLPLRCRGPQTVLLQQSNLLEPADHQPSARWSKYTVGRAVFRSNLDRVHAVIVQTEVMRTRLERCCPAVAGRVHVVSQPVPTWLLHSGVRRVARYPGAGLKLIYPAAGYPHKNHALLAKLDPRAPWPIERLDLTLEASAHPAPGLPWLRCRGFLSPQAMLEAYGHADALLFLSKEESYGFPLVEAMFVGLPVVCPDRDYAHALCGDQALYFDPDEPASLLEALSMLQARLESGWWPDWRSRLLRIPPDWETVARAMLAIACAPPSAR